MRNKKISKLVDPSFRLYFLVGFLFAAVTVRVSIPLAICEAGGISATRRRSAARASASISTM